MKTVMSSAEILSIYENAACAGKPPHYWTDTATAKEQREALIICMSCPVRAACLQRAINTHANGVIQGGHKFDIPDKTIACIRCPRRLPDHAHPSQRYCSQQCQRAAQREAKRQRYQTAS